MYGVSSTEPDVWLEIARCMAMGSHGQMYGTCEGEHEPPDVGPVSCSLSPEAGDGRCTFTSHPGCTPLPHRYVSLM